MFTTPLGDFGLPPDAAAWGALLLALLCVWTANGKRLLARVPDAHFVAIAAIAAALLSLGYVAHYLRGGPRIVDATSYYLEARGLSEGHVRIPFGFPGGSFRGRFLLADGSGESLAVIFPPGYPALLALGFVAGAPLLVGPCLAAVLVVLTFQLALRLFGRSDVARLAALLSVSSATLFDRLSALVSQHRGNAARTANGGEHPQKRLLRCDRPDRA
jgi:hypothetical protein